MSVSVCKCIGFSRSILVVIVVSRVTLGNSNNSFTVHGKCQQQLKALLCVFDTLCLLYLLVTEGVLATVTIGRQ